MAQIKPQDMVNWFRAKSKEFGSMADSLEATFNLATGAPAVGMTRFRRQIEENEPPQDLTDPDLITAESVRTMMRGKSMRIGPLAGACGLTESALENIIRNPNSGLELGTRGWVKLSES